jgi:hypothetical protein
MKLALIATLALLAAGCGYITTSHSGTGIPLEVIEASLMRGYAFLPSTSPTSGGSMTPTDPQAPQECVRWVDGACVETR